MSEAAASSASAGGRAWRWLAWAWLVVVLALGLQQVMFWRAPAIDTDIMALLPGATEDARLAAANQRLSDAVTGDVVVLLSAPDWQSTHTAARTFASAIATGRTLRMDGADDADALSRAIAFHAPHRQGLLTPAQRQWLRYRDAEFVFIDDNWTLDRFGRSYPISRGAARVQVVRGRVVELLRYLKECSPGRAGAA